MNDYLTDVEFKALHELFLGYFAAFKALPQYMQDAYYVRARALGRSVGPDQ
jgi:hypothetical protein